jgi:hypothetical protein
MYHDTIPAIVDGAKSEKFHTVSMPGMPKGINA